jgi:meso-butanediol dehydrogenase/(S,S)-butanediol dehydrogenase/diacetyl reductase
MSKNVALVTGSSQGIGEAIARRLSKDGFAVCVSANHNVKGAQRIADEIVEAGGEAIAVAVDVADPASVDAAVDTVASHFGDFTVMVNNAGIAPASPVGSITPELFDQAFHTNVLGTFNGCQSAIRKFRELGHGGKIINATSQGGVVGAAGMSLYCSTKFAIRGITQSFAKEVAPEGILVNAYAPGVVDTPMMRKIAEANGFFGDDGMQEYADKYFTAGIALGRLSTSEDVANGVSFLAGPDSNYMTGQTLIVDGGMQFH